jgi:hypothetical protein
VAEEDITTQIEQVEKTTTRITRKRAKVKKILLVLSGAVNICEGLNFFY